MFLKSRSLATKIIFFTVLGILGAFVFKLTLQSNETKEKVSVSSVPPVAAQIKKPEFVKGIHLTSWAAGSKKGRERTDTLLKETEINTVVIAIKEYEGEVYIPGVPLAEKYKLFTNAMPDLKNYISKLKQQGVYLIARLVVFKDRTLPAKKPEWAVKKADGSVWRDRRGNAWVDPYNKEVWDYNLSIASQAVVLGFDEIQFDYIRFPSDGDTKQCRYSYQHHNSSSAAQALDNFLKYASEKLKPMGVYISIDVFGLTPSVQHDMGIGQKIMGMTQWVDYVSPMVYPSHYAKGEYGIREPNREPFKVVHKTMSDAIRRFGEMRNRLRPYLQDFSLGYKYGPKEVRAQIEACEELGIHEWLLWSPNCNYTKIALKSKKGILDPVAQVPQSMMKKIEESRKTAQKKEDKKISVEISSPTVFKSTDTGAKKENDTDQPSVSIISPISFDTLPASSKKEIEKSSPTAPPQK